jgi:hypothetical protein
LAHGTSAGFDNGVSYQLSLARALAPAMLLQWESQAAALQLLGHASAHTTAEYAKSKLRQLRELVERA